MKDEDTPRIQISIVNKYCQPDFHFPFRQFLHLFTLRGSVDVIKGSGTIAIQLIMKWVAYGTG